MRSYLSRSSGRAASRSSRTSCCRLFVYLLVLCCAYQIARKQFKLERLYRAAVPLRTALENVGLESVPPTMLLGCTRSEPSAT